MRAAGLKVNAPKCILVLKKINFLDFLGTLEGINPDLMKVQESMHIRIPNTTTDSLLLIGMPQYFLYMWPMWSHMLSPMIGVVNYPKDRKIFWVGVLEYSFKEIKCTASEETLFNCSYWKIYFNIILIPMINSCLILLVIIIYWFPFYKKLSAIHNVIILLHRRYLSQ